MVFAKPPPRADLLVPEYLAAVDQLHGERPLIIGGKSMGGRVASMVADDLHAAGKIVGLLCLGYPFHPPGKPASFAPRTSLTSRRRRSSARARVTRSARAKRSRAMNSPSGSRFSGWRTATTI
jgi:thioesterase domain-containing protein